MDRHLRPCTALLEAVDLEAAAAAAVVVETRWPRIDMLDQQGPLRYLRSTGYHQSGLVPYKARYLGGRMDRHLRPCTALLEVVVDLEAAMAKEKRKYPMSPSWETTNCIQSPGEHHSEAATPT